MSARGSGDEARIAALKLQLLRLLHVEREVSMVNVMALVDLAAEIATATTASKEFRMWAAGYLAGVSAKLRGNDV